ncbi:hypothetical protein DACRYDRAFT_14288 [Dacryopinax primogenitus]|uniref:Uncharacterized protein n=1 Tax=Dacryopinax primogenitus (strain DJM 731) TaxID=1858805 RepID=M5G1J8_DACPD|nr:uncharacterized protein DACRYDRAFT_14288 [Dacryopinax primogenitus]EJU04096.1 hypothetical protein DACRYDRAFT_14288 [Dacryopinax primogenitus]
MVGHARPLLDYLDANKHTTFLGMCMINDMEETGAPNPVHAEMVDADLEEEFPTDASYPIVSFNFQCWFTDKNISRKNLPRGPTQPVKHKFNSDGPANCTKAKTEAPDWTNILNNDLDLQGYDMHPYMSLIPGKVCHDVYFKYFMPKLFKLVQDHYSLAFKTMAYIKANLMDQAMASMAAKRTKEKSDAAYKKACKLAQCEGHSLPPKPEKIEIPCIKQCLLAVEEAIKIPANHPLLAYAKAFTKWEQAEEGNGASASSSPSSFLSLLGHPPAQASQAGTSTPMVCGKDHAPSNLALTSTPTPKSTSTPFSHECADSGSSLILPMMPTAPASSHTATMTLGTPASTIGSPAHIFNATGSACMVHAVGHGKILTANPTKSFSQLIFMHPNDEEGYHCMHELPYNTCAACANYFHDVGQEHASAIEYNLIASWTSATAGSRQAQGQHISRAAKLLDVVEQAWIQMLDKISINMGFSKDIINANMKGRKAGYFNNKHHVSLHNAAKHLLAKEAWARGTSIASLVDAGSFSSGQVFYWALPENQPIINSKVDWLCEHPEAALSVEQSLLAKQENKHLQVQFPGQACQADTVLVQDTFQKEASS